MSTPGLARSNAAGSRSRWRWTIAAVVALVLLVGAVSCGGDGDEGSEGGDDATTTTTTEGTASPDEDGDGGEDGPGGEDDSGGEDGDPDGGGAGSPSRRGDSGPLELTAAEEAYRDAVLGELTDVEDLPDVDLPCLVGRWVRAFGLEELEAEGVTPADLINEGPSVMELTREQAEALAQSYAACGVALVDVLVPEGDDPSLACVREAVDPDDVFEYLVLTFLKDGEGLTALQESIAADTAHCEPEA